MSTRTKNGTPDSTKQAQWAEQILRRPPQTGAPVSGSAHRLTLLSLLPQLLPVPPEPVPQFCAADMPVRDRLALRVRLLRAARGWSQEDLAEQSGLHRNYIGHIERAELNAGLDNIEKIARAFGVTLCALLDPGAANRRDRPSIEG